MAANNKQEGDTNSRRKPTANGTPPSVMMVCLERGLTYYNNNAFSIYEEVGPTEGSTNQPSWILKRTLDEDTYETIRPSVEVGTTTTPPKKPEADKKGDRSRLRAAGRLRQKMCRFRSEHQAEIRYVIYAVLTVAYSVYFTFAMLHEFGSEASVRLLCLTLLAVFICLVSLLGRCGPGMRTPQPMIKFGHFLRRHQRILTVCLCVLIAAGLVAFLVVDVALKRPSNLMSLLGIFIFVFLTFIFSANPEKVRWRAVLWGLGLQFVFGLVVLRTPWGNAAFRWLGDRVQEFLGHTDAGAKFVFGKKFVDHPFAMKVLPVIIFFSCSISVLYHLGVMQAIITRLAWLMQRTMGTTAAESTNAAGNIFIGQTEAPLLIRPLIQGMTRSELHAVMVAGFASIAGAVLATYILLGVPANHLITASVMAAPCALALSKLSYPETGESKTSEQNIARLEESPHNSVIEAASAGASASIKIVANIAVNLIAFIAMLRFVNATLTWFGHRVGLVAPHQEELTFQMICSYVLWPCAFVMGVSSDDCRKMAELVGVKIFINEFVAYGELSVLIANSHTFRDYNGTWTRLNYDIHLHDSNITLVGGVLHERTIVIATYALCGFANISSIGLVLGVLGSMAQDRKSDIADLVVRAMIIGNIVCFMNASTAGLLHQGTT